MMSAIMHRTQIQLEDWQYESLKSTAEREGRSLAEVVREAVAVYLDAGTQTRRARLRGMRGIGDDASAGRDHDRYLYGAGRGA